MRHVLATLVFLALSFNLQAQPTPKTPEHLLPADCLAYYRYDGYEPHRKAYDQTALAKVMKEGLAELFDHAFGQLFTIGNDSGAAQAKKDDPRPHVETFLDGVWKRGFALSVEAAPRRPEGGGFSQVTIVFPDGAEKKHRQAFEKIFRLAARGLTAPMGNEAPVEEEVYKGRRLHVARLASGYGCWWTEGKHLVLALVGGAGSIEPVTRLIDGRRSNLTTAKWYPELTTFKRYETDMRGYVNLEAVVDHLAVVGLDVPGLANLKDHVARQFVLGHLGLNGLKNLTFHLGFDGKYQRSTVRLGLAESKRRTGLLDLASGSIAFDPAKLPPLPPDADYVGAWHVNWGNIFDYIRTSYGLLALSRLFDGELPKRFPDLDRIIGGDFRKDFLDQLDTTLVSYGAHSEGPFLLGQGFAVKVKDAAKVRKGLAGIVKALGEIDPRLIAEKRMFRGEEMHVFSNFYLPLTVAVHKDWLVFGLFPQPVQGFVLRSGGKYRVWKAPPELEEVLAKERKENLRGKLLGVSVQDPRPVVEMGLALLPVLTQFANQTAHMRVFDVSKIPNAQSVNEWLFPNIRLCYDDGDAFRWENHYSINEPDDFAFLLLSPLVPGMLDFVPRNFAGRAPGLDVAPPPMIERIEAPRRADPKQPESSTTAAAAAKDGTVTINVVVSRQVPYTETRKVPYQVEEVVVVSGVARKVRFTAYKEEVTTREKTVSESRVLIADGKTVKVTRKDGKAVDPTELPKLLEKETKVLLVTTGEIDAEQLQRLDERTLIITVSPAGGSSK